MRTLGADVRRRLAEPIAAMLAVAIPFVHAWRGVSIQSSLAVLIPGVLASAAVGWLWKRFPARAGIIRWTVFATAGLVVAIGAYKFVGAWLVLGLVLADWAVRGHGPISRLKMPATDALIGFSAITALMTFRAFGSRSEIGYGPYVTYAIGAASAVVILVVGSTVPHFFERLIRTVRHLVGRAVTIVTFGPLGLLIVALPGFVQPVLWSSPSRLGRRTRGRWLVRTTSNALPQRQWGRERFASITSNPMRLARLLIVFPLIGMTMGTIRLYEIATGTGWKSPLGGFRLDSGSDNVASAAVLSRGVPQAVSSDAWYPDYRKAIDWMINQKTAFRPFEPIRLVDVASPYINVRNGSRQTWTAPVCSCKRLTVWMYGGSTTFGLDQRDDHTIASDIARLAHEDGMAVDVVNKGVLGDMHWEEAQRFAWDVTVQDPPDLVVFYDGVNEIWGTNALVEGQMGDVPRPVEPLTQDIWRGLMDSDGGSAPSPPEGVSLVTPKPVTTEGAIGSGELTATRYLRSLQMSADTAAANGIPVRWVWQPTRVSRPWVDNEYGTSFAADSYSREKYEAATAIVRKRPDVLDLSDVFDKNRQPLFTDDVHHNERGAKLIADALYSDLKDQFVSLLEKKGGT